MKNVCLKTLTEVGLVKTNWTAEAIALSIWYLKRLNSIQFDEKGIPQIKKVLKEYKIEVNPI